LLKPGEDLFSQRLLPEGLVELSSDAPVAGLYAGNQLVELYSETAVVACDARPHPSKLLGLLSPASQPCLIDEDRDGRFEGFFYVPYGTGALFYVLQDRPKKSKAIPPVAYRSLNPDQFALSLSLRLTYVGRGKIRPRYVFDTRFGSEKRYDRITNSYTIDYSAVGTEQSFMGAKFRILDETPAGLHVEVFNAIPRQSFGLLVIGPH
jgi:hypothetical protein